jgi:hypothetical protein
VTPTLPHCFTLQRFLERNRDKIPPPGDWRMEAIRSYPSDASLLPGAALQITIFQGPGLCAMLLPCESRLYSSGREELDARPSDSVVFFSCHVSGSLQLFCSFLDANNHPRQASRQKGLALEMERRETPSEVVIVLWTIFVILLVLWLVGMVSSYTLGGFIHLLLVLALIVLILQLVSGRRGPIV